MGFGLVIEFIELLQNVNTSNHSAIAISYQSLPGNGFQRRSFTLLLAGDCLPND
jgi:hypothetical protein